MSSSFHKNEARLRSVESHSTWWKLAQGKLPRNYRHYWYCFLENYCCVVLLTIDIIVAVGILIIILFMVVSLREMMYCWSTLKRFELAFLARFFWIASRCNSLVFEFSLLDPLMIIALICYWTRCCVHRFKYLVRFLCCWSINHVENVRRSKTYCCSSFAYYCCCYWCYSFCYYYPYCYSDFIHLRTLNSAL